MRKFYSAIMALTVLLFASCDKNEGDIGTTDDGIQTKMGLTISFPETSTTKAIVDDNATAPDKAVNSITVYVFESNGTLAKGGYNVFDLDDDFEVAGDNKYTLKEGKIINTTSGPKNIYVGFNLPDQGTDAPVPFDDEITEPDFINAASTIGFWEDGNDGYVAMLGRTSETLETDADGAPKTNNVSVTVTRTVAKIAVNKGSDLSYDVDNGTDVGTFTVTPDKYTVGNLSPEFYPVQRLDDDDNLVTPAYSTAVAPVLGSQVDLNAKNTLPVDLLTAFYVPERAPKNLQKEATYTVVRAKLAITHTAKLVGEVITLTSGAPTGPIKVVTNGIDTYFCAPADADAVAAKLIGPNVYDYEDAGEDTGEYYTFYHVFFNVKENPTKKPRLAIFRNNIYHLTISGVSGIGVPGKPNDPKEPPVDPPGPEDPVYEEDTNLKVEITIAPWECVFDEDVILKPW